MDSEWAALKHSLHMMELEAPAHAQAEAAASAAMGGRAMAGSSGEEEHSADSVLSSSAARYPYEELDQGWQGQRGEYHYQDIGGEGYPLGDTEGRADGRASPTSTLLKLSLAHSTTPANLLAHAVAQGIPEQSGAGQQSETPAEKALAAAFARRGPDSVIGGQAVFSSRVTGVAPYPEDTPTVAATLMGIQKGEVLERRAQAARPRVGLGTGALLPLGGATTTATIRVNGGQEEEGGVTVTVQGGEGPTPAAQLASSLRPSMGATGVLPEDLSSRLPEDYTVPTGGTHPLLVPLL
jgi:hypothetical protein